MTNAEASTTREAATPAEQGATVASKEAASKKGARRKKGAPKGQKGTKAAKKVTKPKPAARKGTPEKVSRQARANSKKVAVLDLLRRKDGATLAEIMERTGWMAHSVRGFVSGTLIKKMDLPVASLKNEKGERVYRMEK